MEDHFIKKMLICVSTIFYVSIDNKTQQSCSVSSQSLYSKAEIQNSKEETNANKHNSQQHCWFNNNGYE
jgi:hypothetical protein